LSKGLDAAPALATPAPGASTFWHGCLPAMAGLMGCIAVAAFIYFMLHRLQQNIRPRSGQAGVAKLEQQFKSSSLADLAARAKLNRDQPNQLETGEKTSPVAKSAPGKGKGKEVLDDRCRTAFPTVCPPYMRAEQGAKLSVQLECDVAQTWSSAVTGLAAGMAVRGPEVGMLAVAVRWTFPRAGAAAERVLQILEREPGGDISELGIDRVPAGRVLLTVTSRGELWLASEDQPSGAEQHLDDHGVCLGSLQPQAQLGGGAGGCRRMFCWERRESAGKAQEADETFGHGLPTLAVIIGKKEIELGEMPSGRLVASAAYSEACSPPSRAEQASASTNLMKVTVKPGIDAALALGCILGVSLLQTFHETSPEASLEVAEPKESI